MAWGGLRRPAARRVLLAAVVGALLSACGATVATDLVRAPAPERSIEADAAAGPAPFLDATPSTEAPPPPPPPPPPDPIAEARAAGLDVEARVVITPTGVVVPVLGFEAGRYRVLTPCANEATVGSGTPLRSATVVLDPGHGGPRDPGAVGPNGLTEAALNGAVTRYVRERLEEAGIDVVQTRYHDHPLSLQSRAEIANALGARAFVSIHFNGGPEGVYDRPGTEMYHQVADPESRRLAGLLQEEVVAFYSQVEGIAWHGNSDAGAKYRPRWDGDDYYGVLRRAHVPAVLTESLFLSSSVAEADLLARPEVQAGNGAAIARAIWRFLATDEPGSGFVEPKPRHLGNPQGGGGPGRACDDPRLE